MLGRTENIWVTIYSSELSSVAIPTAGSGPDRAHGLCDMCQKYQVCPHLTVNSCAATCIPADIGWNLCWCSVSDSTLVINSMIDWHRSCATLLKHLSSNLPNRVHNVTTLKCYSRPCASSKLVWLSFRVGAN